MHYKRTWESYILKARITLERITEVMLVLSFYSLSQRRSFFALVIWHVKNIFGGHVRLFCLFFGTFQNQVSIYDPECALAQTAKVRWGFIIFSCLALLGTATLGTIGLSCVLSRSSHWPIIRSAPRVWHSLPWRWCAHFTSLLENAHLKQAKTGWWCRQSIHEKKLISCGPPGFIVNRGWTVVNDETCQWDSRFEYESSAVITVSSLGLHPHSSQLGANCRLDLLDFLCTL